MRLIDADDKTLTNRINLNFGSVTRFIVKKILNDAPTIDAEPVVHAKWAYIGGDEWCCTNCGDVKSTEGRWEPMLDKFCSECGAKMDSEE